MKLDVHRLAAFALALALQSAVTGAPGVAATADAPIKLIVLTDMSGIYSAGTGRGSVMAVQMAAEDFGGTVLGRKIIVEGIDHRNNAVEGATKLREAFDDGGDVVFDLTNSAVALAAAGVAKDKKRLAIVTGAGTTDLYGSACNKYTYDYGFDTYSLAHAAGAEIASRPNGKSWYVIAPDYAFGRSMLAAYTDAVKANAGTIVHADMTPPGTSDFSPYLLAAKGSHAGVLGILNAGVDAENATKQARLFGLDKQMTLAMGYLATSEIDAVPDVFAGTLVTQNWFWTKDPASRAWTARFAARMDGKYPTDVQAADYSAAMQWLAAVAAVKSDDADKIVAYLDGRRFNDFYAVHGEWRARDHRVLHDVYVVSIIDKDHVKEPHGWYKLQRTVDAAVAFPPESASVCKKDW